MCVVGDNFGRLESYRLKGHTPQGECGVEWSALVSVQHNSARPCKFIFQRLFLTKQTCSIPVDGGLCAVRRKVFEGIPISSCIPQGTSRKEKEIRLYAKAKQTTNKARHLLHVPGYPVRLLSIVYNAGQEFAPPVSRCSQRTNQEREP